MHDDETSVFQKPLEEVLEEEGSVISDVGIIPDRGPARVHFDLTLLHRRELFEFVTERICELNQLKDFLSRFDRSNRGNEAQNENSYKTTKISRLAGADKTSKDNYFEMMFRLVMLLYSS